MAAKPSGLRAESPGRAGRKERALAALLQGLSVRTVAESIKVSERTLYRWLAESGFRREFYARRREQLLQGLGSVQTLAPTAAEALKTIVSDPQSSAASRVSAARSILQFACQSLELDDLEERLAELEQFREESPPEGPGWSQTRSS